MFCAERQCWREKSILLCLAIRRLDGVPSLGFLAEAALQPHPLHGSGLDSLSADIVSQASHFPSLQGPCRDRAPSCEQTGCPKQGATEISWNVHCTLTSVCSGGWTALHSHQICLGGSANGHQCLLPFLSRYHPSPISTSSQILANSSPSPSVRVQLAPSHGCWRRAYKRDCF